MAKKETVIIFGAHTDDFVLGAGGTVANYVKEGRKVIAIIFSFGEKSHIWMKEHVVKKIRSEETLEAAKILGCETIIFNLQELKFYEDYQKKGLEKDILKVLEKEKPTKIFTHSGEDPHPDHKNINKITLELLEKLSFKPELYIYSVWNPVSLKTKFPALYINTTKTFWTKMKALKSFKSQQIHISYPLFLVLFRDIKNGLKKKGLTAEMFYRIK